MQGDWFLDEEEAFVMPTSLDKVESFEDLEVGDIIWAYYRVLDEAIKVPMVIKAIYPQSQSWAGECCWGIA